MINSCTPLHVLECRGIAVNHVLFAVSRMQMHGNELFYMRFMHLLKSIANYPLFHLHLKFAHVHNI